jgi:hypothetical protein
VKPDLIEREDIERMRRVRAAAAKHLCRRRPERHGVRLWLRRLCQDLRGNAETLKS